MHRRTRSTANPRMRPPRGPGVCLWFSTRLVGIGDSRDSVVQRTLGRMVAFAPVPATRRTTTGTRNNHMARTLAERIRAPDPHSTTGSRTIMRSGPTNGVRSASLTWHQSSRRCLSAACRHARSLEEPILLIAFEVRVGPGWEPGVTVRGQTAYQTEEGTAATADTPRHSFGNRRPGVEAPVAGGHVLDGAR